MRALVITVAVIAVVVLVLVMVGWIRLSSPDGNPTLQVDTGEVKEDTGEMMDRGAAAVEGIRQEAEEVDDEEVPPSRSTDNDNPPVEPVGAEPAQ